MTGRERFLTALSNKKPDYLPCQVHEWMQYYLKTYLNGRDQYEAYKYVGMDPVIYQNAAFEYDKRSLADWNVKYKTYKNGEYNGWEYTIVTPKGELRSRSEANQFTGWCVEYPIKTKKDFEIWAKYVPVPNKVDWAPVIGTAFIVTAVIGVRVVTAHRILTVIVFPACPPLALAETYHR